MILLLLFALDNTVRIWRVFPFAEDALAPLMFILNSEPATHLVYSRHRLCIALQDPSTATYNLTMFKTTDTEPGKANIFLLTAIIFVIMQPGHKS